MTTLKAALALATPMWAGRKGASCMASFVAPCIVILGGSRSVQSLGPSDGVAVLAGLRDRGLSPKSVACYYGAFRRLLALNGVACTGWPKAPSPPRHRAREAMTDPDLAGLIEFLSGAGWSGTADLARLMRATGLRINVEALKEAHLELQPGDAYDTLIVTGKGGHERPIPIVDPEVRALLKDRVRLAAMRRPSYSTHLRRWNAAAKSVGIKSRLATPHSVRHSFATNTLARSGGNLVLTQELMGHADPATTARYIHVDLKAKAEVMG